MNQNGLSLAQLSPTCLVNFLNQYLFWKVKALHSPHYIVILSLFLLQMYKHTFQAHSEQQPSHTWMFKRSELQDQQRYQKKMPVLQIRGNNEAVNGCGGEVVEDVESV